jgi:hypothetical protein
VRVASFAPALQVLPTSGTPAARSLEPGQVLHALVTAAASGNQVILRVGSMDLMARTELALTAGQALVLQVVKGGELPELRVLRPPTDQELVAQALRATLPRQLPLTEILAGIAEAWQRAAGAAIPAPVARDITALLRALAPPAPDAAALRRAFDESGLLFEAKLAQGRFDPADVKGILVRLLARLAETRQNEAGARPEHAPPDREAETATPATARLLSDIGRQLEGALARIQWEQLASLPADGEPRQVWHLQLPLGDPGSPRDGVSLRFEHEPGQGRTAAAERWSVALQFSLEPIGPLHVRLTLAEGAVASAFWAERAESVAVIRDHLPMLEAALNAAGLQVGRLSAQAGRPPQPAADIPPPVTGLLDERA